MKTEVIYRGIGCGSFAHILTIVFITLKLTGNINWSWWYVLMPSVVMIAIGLSALLVFSVLTIFVLASNGAQKGR